MLKQCKNLLKYTKQQFQDAPVEIIILRFVISHLYFRRHFNEAQLNYHHNPTS